MDFLRWCRGVVYVTTTLFFSKGTQRGTLKVAVDLYSMPEIFLGEVAGRLGKTLEPTAGVLDPANFAKHVSERSQVCRLMQEMVELMNVQNKSPWLATQV